jgi:hypothetical protein
MLTALICSHLGIEIYLESSSAPRKNGYRLWYSYDYLADALLRNERHNWKEQNISPSVPKFYEPDWGVISAFGFGRFVCWSHYNVSACYIYHLQCVGEYSIQQHYKSYTPNEITYCIFNTYWNFLFPEKDFKKKYALKKHMRGLNSFGSAPMFPLSCAGARPRRNWSAPAHAELFPRSWNFLIFIVNIFIAHITKKNF